MLKRLDAWPPVPVPVDAGWLGWLNKLDADGCCVVGAPLEPVCCGCDVWDADGKEKPEAVCCLPTSPNRPPEDVVGGCCVEVELGVALGKLNMLPPLGAEVVAGV